MRGEVELLLLVIEDLELTQDMQFGIDTKQARYKLMTHGHRVTKLSKYLEKFRISRDEKTLFLLIDFFFFPTNLWVNLWVVLVVLDVWILLLLLLLLLGSSSSSSSS